MKKIDSNALIQETLYMIEALHDGRPTGEAVMIAPFNEYSYKNLGLSNESLNYIIMSPDKDDLRQFMDSELPDSNFEHRVTEVPDEVKRRIFTEQFMLVCYIFAESRAFYTVKIGNPPGKFLSKKATNFLYKHKNLLEQNELDKFLDETTEAYMNGEISFVDEDALIAFFWACGIPVYED